jgi:hypothetical protein
MLLCVPLKRDGEDSSLSADLPVVGLRRAGQGRDPGHPAPGALFPPSGGWDPSWRGTVAHPAPAHSGTILDPVPEGQIKN